MARGEVRTGEHGGQEGEAETLAALRTFEGGYSLRGAVDRPTKVALVIVGRAEEAVRQRLQDDFPAGRGEHEGALGGSDGLVIRPPEKKIVGQKERDLSQPTRVIEGLREGLRFTQVRQDTLQVACRQERRAQGESEIDGLLARAARLRQTLEGTERLLEVAHRLTVGRPGQGL